MTKLCIYCDTEKSVERFYWHSTRQSYSAECKDCRHTRWKETKDKIKRPPKVYSEPDHKICNKCGIDKFKKEYYPDTETRRRAVCIQCDKEKHLRWFVANPGESRWRNLKSKYGMTQQDYEEMLDIQGGGCAVCGVKEQEGGKSYNLSVDHCHLSNRVRGILCRSCNLAVGFMKDDPQRVRKVLEYLERTG